MIELLSDLINARLVAEAHPDTFSRPSAEDLTRLQPGDHVKIARHGERFWVQLTEISGDRLIGRVANDLIIEENADLSFRTVVCLEKDHIYDVQPLGGPVIIHSTRKNVGAVRDHAQSAAGRKR